MFHTVAMFQRAFAERSCPIHNLYDATVFVAWTIVSTYLLIGVWGRLRFLGAFASPLLFATGVFALMLPAQAVQPQFTGGWLSLHAALILLSYGAFGLSAVASAMYLMQDRNLKFN